MFLKFRTQIGKIIHQRLSSGYHHRPGLCIECIFNNPVCFNQRMNIRIPGEFRVTPAASYITSANANKISRFASMVPFTLNGVKFFY